MIATCRTLWATREWCQECHTHSPLQEGNLLDFDIGLYFYEQLCKYVEDPKNAATYALWPFLAPLGPLRVP